MSYDIRICVKAEGCNVYPVIAAPEYDSPTYNLGKMFRACMSWDYSQGEYYPADFVVEKVEKGIRELRTNRAEYMRYNPANGWGSIDGAITALESLRDCIYEQAEEIPLNCMYMRW